MPRPRLKPTDEQRRLVKSLAAMGVPHEHIARKVNIRSPKTLRKHYRDELDTGSIDANYKVTRTLFEMATSGKHPQTTIHWDVTRNRQREHREAPPPFIVGQDLGGQPRA